MNVEGHIAGRRSQSVRHSRNLSSAGDESKYNTLHERTRDIEAGRQMARSYQWKKGIKLSQSIVSYTPDGKLEKEQKKVTMRKSRSRA